MLHLLDSVRNIHAIGRNYVAHALELGNAVPKEPVIFAKSPATLVTGDSVRLPAGMGDLHHELELVLRLGQNIPVGDFSGLDCISHIGLGIDFTARSRQKALKEKGLPWHLAKNFRDGCYVTGLTHEFSSHQNFRFSLSVNGEIRQDGDSSLMLFPFAALLAHINQSIPLMKGDLIYTGTPEGVGPVEDGDMLRLCCAGLSIEQDLTVHIQ